MDTIYLVETGIEWEGGSIKGTFHSLEKAESFIEDNFIAEAKTGKGWYDYALIYSLSLTEEGTVPKVVKSINLRDFMPPPFEAHYRVYNIEYDFDKTHGIKCDLSNAPSLPKQIMIVVYDKELVDPANKEQLEEYLSNNISDTTGFCHNGFKYNRLDPKHKR